MTFGRTYLEFPHDLLYLKHIPDPQSGFCIQCESPRRFHPCPVRERIVAHLIEVGHIGNDEYKDILQGRTPCACDKGSAIFVPCS